MINVSLRLGIKSDLPFIYNSWMKSFSEGNKDFERMGDAVYYSGLKKKIDGCLENSAAIIACNPEDQTQIFGYAVGEIDGDLLHYVYVKYPYRKFGICRKLLLNVHPDLGRDDSPLVCTFANHNFDALKKKYNLIYNPFVR